MPSEEKANPLIKWLFIPRYTCKQAVFGSIFLAISTPVCLILLALLYWLGVPYWNVPIFNGMDETEIKAVLQEALPVGTSRTDVESYIAERMQASHVCSWLENNDDEICHMFAGNVIISTSVMVVQFSFEENRLTEINVGGEMGCL